MIDMAMLIMEKQPDASGNVIPANIQEGSAQFESAKGHREKITLVVSGGIYNVATATCGATCTNCCGDSADGYSISPNSFYLAIGQSLQCSTSAVDCNGFQVAPSSWSSDNTSIMTVNSSGQVTGVAVGSTTIYATWDNVIETTGQVCSGGTPVCPSGSPQASAGGNTTPTASINCSPTDLALGSTAPTSTTNGSCTSTVNPSGGTFAWYIITNTNPNPITLNQNGSTASYVSANPSASVGDTAIRLIYTLNQQQGVGNSESVWQLRCLAGCR